MTTSTEINPVQTLGLLWPGAPVELRVLVDKMRVQRFSDHGSAVRWAEQFTAARAVYVVMNSFDPQQVNGNGVSDIDVTRRNYFLVDVDPVRPTDTNSSDLEFAIARVVAEQVRDYLTNRGWPEPVEADSGNGVHLLWPIDLPNDVETHDAVTGALHYLAQRFSTPDVKLDTTVANASRITKLYGTWARKGPSTHDRPHRLSAITKMPTSLQHVSLDRFLALAALWEKLAPPPVPKSDSSLPSAMPVAARIALAQAWLSLQPTAVEGEHGDAHTYQICCAVAVEHDLGPDDAMVALGDWNARCQPPWSDHELRAKLTNAIKYAKGVRGRRLTFPTTEAGDAECFASLYQDVVRFDHRQRRWLVSDPTSGIWVPDPVEQLTQMSVRMMRARQKTALAFENPAEKKRHSMWAIKGEDSRRLRNTLTLARSVPPIADVGDNWDQDAYLLGVQNGVLDLRTGQFRKARPADRITLRVRVPFDADARCPLWRSTLASIFAPNDLFDASESQRVVMFIQRAVGYSTTGDCREECCFFLWGAGSNGKGTVMNTLAWLLADYTDDMPYATLERSVHGHGIPNDVAKLAGKRFITCSEVNEFAIDEPRLKALTGRDPITARYLRCEYFTFIPVGKIWIATNNKPKIAGTDDGIWRRIHLIPFLQKFEEGGNINKNLKDQLREELPGILNWIVEGAQMWWAEGLNPPASVRAATAAYRSESNPITPFVEACCVVGGGLQMQAALAMKVYERHCHANNVEPWLRLSDKAFHKSMKQRFDVQSRDRKTFYLGVGLRTDVPPPTEAEET